MVDSEAAGERELCIARRCVGGGRTAWSVTEITNSLGSDSFGGVVTTLMRVRNNLEEVSSRR